MHVVPQLCLLCYPLIDFWFYWFWNLSGCKRESPTHFGAILSEFLLVESGWAVKFCRDDLALQPGSVLFLLSMCRPSIFCQTQKWKERFQIIQLTCRSAPVESPATSVWTGAYACSCTSLAPTFKTKHLLFRHFFFLRLRPCTLLQMCGDFKASFFCNLSCDFLDVLHLNLHSRHSIRASWHGLHGGFCSCWMFYAGDKVPCPLSLQFLRWPDQKRVLAQLIQLANFSQFLGCVTSRLPSEASCWQIWREEVPTWSCCMSWQVALWWCFPAQG